MQPINYKYSDRHYQHRDEPEPYRSLPMTTKGLGEYCRKLVDIEGGWLELRGREPADALRHASNGRITRSDFRILKRAVGELLDARYFERGQLDAYGLFFPLATGDYLAIRDWIPSQRGMTRQQTRDWYAEREERAAQHLAERVADLAPRGEPSATNVTAAATPSEVAAKDASRTHTTPAATPPRPTLHQKRTDRSATTQNSNGTEVAGFRSLPFQSPLSSPQGESAVADRRARFRDSSSANRSRVRDSTAIVQLARQAAEWINQQHCPPTEFTADDRDIRRRARAWHKAGLDWPTLESALELRLTAQKATHPHDWSNWVTPSTFFNPKLERYVAEVAAGHRYRVVAHHGSRNGATDDPRLAAKRARQQIDQAHAQRQHDAERAFADVLDVVDLVGADGDWASELPHSTARSTIRDLGWQRVVEERERIRDAFFRRFLGGPAHGSQLAA